jgi:hypothetical protein
MASDLIGDRDRRGVTAGRSDLSNPDRSDDRLDPMTSTETDAELRLAIRAGLPEPLRALVKALPADRWADHPGFGGLTQFWLEKHGGFRQMTALLVGDAAAAGGGEMALDHYAVRLHRIAGAMLGELHGHHQVEDAHYFPQLRQLTPSVAPGFDLLESDHHDLDAQLHLLAEHINTVLRASQAGTLDRSAASALGETLAAFERLLERHLVDEEEIVIPALLKLAG